MTEGATGIAPEIHDICASKLVAMREDFGYVGAAIDAGIVRAARLLARIGEIDEVPEEVRRRAAAWVAAQSGDPSRERETR